MRNLEKAWGLLLLPVLALYGRNLNDYFIADDFDLIRSFHGEPPVYFLRLLFSEYGNGIWSGEGYDAALGTGYLRPVPIWLLKLDLTLWGPNSLGFHLTSLLVFVALVVAVVKILGELLPDRPAWVWVGGIGVACHPLFGMIVPWIAGREEVAAGCLSLWAIVAFLRFRHHGASIVPFYVLFGLALLTKEWSLPVAGLVVAYDVVHGQFRPWRTRSIRPFGTLALLVCGYFCLRWLAFGNFKGGDGAATHYLSPRAFADYHAQFFGQLLDPSLLAVWARPLAVALVLIALVLGVVVARDRRFLTKRQRVNLLFFGPVWYLGTTVVFHGSEFATRRHVLPLVGLILFGTLLLAHATRALRPTANRMAVAAVITAVCLLHVPVATRHSRGFETASRIVSVIRARVEQATAGLPADSRVLIGRLPQDELPPYYFGWSLQSALKRPFTSNDAASRLEIVNAQNAWMNHRTVDLRQPFDLVLDYPVRPVRLASR